MADTKEKVLLVDDDPTILRLLGKWLELAGYDVITATDGLRAQDIMRSEWPHLLLTDWTMPNLDGLDLCRWLRREQTPHYVYSIILTGRDTQQDVVKGLQAGADDFLKKPIDRNELIARLNAGNRVIDLETKLSLLARTDPLTGLSNQRTLFDMLNREWGRCRRHEQNLACVVLDLDFFKRINDTFGHPSGDEVIRTMAEVLRANSRTSDILSRYGGEEFCVILPETTEEKARQWAERVRTVLSATVLHFDGRELVFSASFGVSQMDNSLKSPQALVDMADQALLAAKQSGRNRVACYSNLTETTQLKVEEDGPATVLRGRVARDAMTTIIMPLNASSPIASATGYFLRFRIGSAPVVDDEGKLVGILSEKDLLAIMLEPDWWKSSVGNVMKENVVSYEEATPLITIYDFLRRVSVRGVVIAHEGKPVGMISRSGLVQWVINAVSTYLVDQTDLAHRSLSTEELRDNMQQMSRELQFQSSRLDDSVNAKAFDELAPCIVGSVTRIQELVTDLLTHVGFAAHGNGKTQDLATMLDMMAATGGNATDGDPA